MTRTPAACILPTIWSERFTISSHILGNVLHPRVAQEICSWRNKTEMNHDGESGNLPGAVLYESFKKCFGLLWRVSVQELAAPFAVPGMCLRWCFVGWIESKTGAAKLLFFRSTRKQDAGEMLDAG